MARCAWSLVLRTVVRGSGTATPASAFGRPGDCLPRSPLLQSSGMLCHTAAGYQYTAFPHPSSWHRITQGLPATLFESKASFAAALLVPCPLLLKLLPMTMFDCLQPASAKSNHALLRCWCPVSLTFQS